MLAGVTLWGARDGGVSGSVALLFALPLGAMAALAFAMAVRLWGAPREPVVVLEHGLLAGWGVGAVPIPLSAVIRVELVPGVRGTTDLIVEFREHGGEGIGGSRVDARPARRTLHLPGCGDSEKRAIAEAIHARL